MTNNNYREKLIEDIKACGESIIENAEVIASDYKYSTSMTITITLEPNEFPIIETSTFWVPERVIEIKAKENGDE